MQRWSFQHTWTQAGVALASLGLFFSFPQNSRAWGRNGHRLVVNKAIDTLPPDIRAFFESNRALLVQHVTDPLDALAKTPAERYNHLIQFRSEERSVWKV